MDATRILVEEVIQALNRKFHYALAVFKCYEDYVCSKEKSMMWSRISLKTNKDVKECWHISPDCYIASVIVVADMNLYRVMTVKDNSVSSGETASLLKAWTTQRWRQAKERTRTHLSTGRPLRPTSMSLWSTRRPHRQTLSPNALYEIIINDLLVTTTKQSTDRIVFSYHELMEQICFVMPLSINAYRSNLEFNGDTLLRFAWFQI